MSKKLIVVILLVVIFLAILSLCCFVVYLVASLSTGGYFSGVDRRTVSVGSADQTVAIIDIDEVISSTGVTDFWGNETADMATRVNNRIQAAIDDENIKGVIFRVNTPGGEVYATRRIYNKIKELKDNGKYVVVLMEDVAASGGYYISAPADKIVASEMTLTGSIGVLFTTIDVSGLYDKVGIKEIIVVNSKGDLKVLEDLDKKDSKAYKLLQAVADDFYQNFVDAVAEGRGLSDTKVKELGDGRVYSGKQAVANGLVDELGEFSEAVTAMNDLAGFDDPNLIILEDQEGSFSGFGASLGNLINPLASVLGSEQPASKITAMYVLQY